jgi:hypothetical protein
MANIPIAPMPQVRGGSGPNAGGLGVPAGSAPSSLGRVSLNKGGGSARLDADTGVLMDANALNAGNRGEERAAGMRRQAAGQFTRIGQQLEDVALRMADTKNAMDLVEAEAAMDNAFMEFSQNLEGDPEDWGTQWAEAQKHLGDQLMERKGLAPVVKQKLKMNLTAYGAESGMRIAGMAQKRRASLDTARFNMTLQQAIDSGDEERADDLLALGVDKGFIAEDKAYEKGVDMRREMTRNSILGMVRGGDHGQAAETIEASDLTPGEKMTLDNANEISRGRMRIDAQQDLSNEIAEDRLNMANLDEGPQEFNFRSEADLRAKLDDMVEGGLLDADRVQSYLNQYAGEVEEFDPVQFDGLLAKAKSYRPSEDDAAGHGFVAIIEELNGASLSSLTKTRVMAEFGDRVPDGYGSKEDRKPAPGSAIEVVSPYVLATKGEGIISRKITELTRPIKAQLKEAIADADAKPTKKVDPKAGKSERAEQERDVRKDWMLTAASAAQAKREIPIRQMRLDEIDAAEEDAKFALRSWLAINPDADWGEAKKMAEQFAIEALGIKPEEIDLPPIPMAPNTPVDRTPMIPDIRVRGRIPSRVDEDLDL